MQRTFIIGGSSGTGQALARELEGSHEIWTASRRGTGPNGCRHLRWDVLNETAPDGELPERLEGLVYCPGSIRLQPFHRLDDDAYREDFELNLLGAVRVLRGVLPALKAASSASVVLFSTVAVTTGMPMHASIAAAKGAVEGLTRSLAAELAPRIRVNAIAPSLTDTPLAAALVRNDRQREAAAERHPLRRIGRPEELAAAARYLLSEESSWMSGQILRLDGGLSSIRRFA